MKSVFLLLGSNLGDRLANLQEARLQISRQSGSIVTTSSVYKTAAWGSTDQPDFFNQAIEIEVFTNPKETLEGLLKIESDMGRIREERWGSRLIDIDILFWNDQIISTPELTIPHPQLQHRRFVLVPLTEIAPEFIHPTLHKTSSQLLDACKDNLIVTKLEL